MWPQPLRDSPPQARILAAADLAAVCRYQLIHAEPAYSGLGLGRPHANSSAVALWRLPISIKLSDAVFVQKRAGEHATPDA